MSKVFVVDTNRQPLHPVHPGKARLLLTSGRAAVLKRYPFTIILKAAIEKPEGAPLRIKIDPGSKTTGLALVNDASGEVIFAAELVHIQAMGHGTRHMCRMNTYGFLRTSAKGAKRVKGFQTGDMVKAVVTHGIKAGSYTGRVAVRATGSFNLTTENQTVQGVSHCFCRIIHRCDSYRYGHGTTHTLSTETGRRSHPPLERRGVPKVEVV